MFPRFHPGLSAATAADAVTGVKAAVHDPTTVVAGKLELDTLLVEVVETLIEDVEVVFTVDVLEVFEVERERVVDFVDEVDFTEVEEVFTEEVEVVFTLDVLEVGAPTRHCE